MAFQKQQNASPIETHGRLATKNAKLVADSSHSCVFLLAFLCFKSALAMLFLKTILALVERI